MTMGAGGPPLIFACTIPAEGAPSLRFLQGWAAMLRVLFDFVVDTRSNPRGAGISDSRPSQKTRRNGARAVLVNARKVKSLGHPSQNVAFEVSRLKCQ